MTIVKDGYMSVIDNTSNAVISVKVNQKRIDAITARNIKEVCLKHISEKARDVHFDFANVSYINSSGIGNLLYVRQILKKYDKELYVDILTKDLRQLFEELLLDNYFVLGETHE